MKDVLKKEKGVISNLKEVVGKRISTNKKVFSAEELTFIKSNSILIEKVYLLGLIDSQKSEHSFLEI